MGAVVPSGSFRTGEAHAEHRGQLLPLPARVQEQRELCHGKRQPESTWQVGRDPQDTCVQPPLSQRKPCPEVSSTLSFVIPKFPDITGVKSATWLLIIVSFIAFMLLGLMCKRVAGRCRRRPGTAPARGGCQVP